MNFFFGTFLPIAGMIFVFALGYLCLNVLIFMLAHRTLASSRTIYDVPLRPRQKRTEFGFYVAFMALFALASATLVTTGAIRFSTFSWTAVIINKAPTAPWKN